MKNVVVRNKKEHQLLQKAGCNGKALFIVLPNGDRSYRVSDHVYSAYTNALKKIEEKEPHSLSDWIIFSFIILFLICVVTFIFSIITMVWVSGFIPLKIAATSLIVGAISLGLAMFVVNEVKKD